MLESVLILDPPDHSVDDLHREFRRQVAADCRVELLTDGDELLSRLRDRQTNRLVVLHESRGDGKRTGLELLEPIRRESPEVPVVVVADHHDQPSTSQAIGAGANDFLVRGDHLAHRVSVLLGKLRALLEVIDRARALDEQNAELQREIQARFRIVGESPQIAKLIEQIKAIARVPRPVLVVGERGTGKELVARAIHFSAGGSTRPIITVNCAAFSDALLESELFGHERGAFTGADQVRHGKFEQADGGTLFLDEIAHMSLPFQQKILRVVEYGTFTRVGGHMEMRTAVRVVAATNVDLKKKIASGDFIRDLYDRLAFEVIQVPPLRERTGDVQVLARHFLNQFALEIPAFRGKTLSRSAVRVLRQYRFPGNVRELKNIIERAAYRDTTNEITPEDIGMLSEDDLGIREGTYGQRVDAFSRRLIHEALKQADGNQASAARLLGLTYHQFRYYRGKLTASQEEA